jgi:hypothetical protein
MSDSRFAIADGDVDLAELCGEFIQRADVIDGRVREEDAANRGVEASSGGDDLIACSDDRRVDQCEAITLTDKIAIHQAVVRELRTVLGYWFDFQGSAPGVLDL